MEIVDKTRRRGRPRKFPRDESIPAQRTAFPFSTSSIPAAETLKENATEKEEVKKAAAEIPEIFTPEQVEWVFDAFVAIVSFIYSLILKIDFQAIQKELEFDKEQKESMSKPLAKICSKYAPSEWAGATAEIQLISMMGVWLVMSFQRAKNVQRRLEEKKRESERTQPVQPIRREPMRDVHVPA